MTATKLEIKTDDGSCPTTFYGDSSRPNVLMYMDGIGMRPALHAMAERLASSGFYVMLPDLFYRIGPYIAPQPAKLFSDPDVRDAWFKQLRQIATTENIMRDTRAFLERLPAAKIGTTGYCMGGRLSLIAAGTFPDRIAAAAAFHPGNLANDAPDSPHLLAKSIKGRVFIAAASDDSSFP